MPLTLDTTVGGASANSYVSAADADAYFAARPFSATWTGQTDAEVKAAALMFATQILDRQEWAGVKGMTAGNAVTQALAFPRRWVPTLEWSASPDVVTAYFVDLTTAYYDSNSIPTPIVRATCELALALLAGGATDPFAADVDRVKRKTVDVLTTEWFASQDQIRGLGRFPHVIQIIQHMLRAGDELDVVRA